MTRMTMMTTKTRAHLAQKLHAKIGFSQKLCYALVGDFITSITDALANGDDVKLASFGHFSIYQKAPRTARNPKTNEIIAVPAKTTVKLTPSPQLKKRLNPNP